MKNIKYILLSIFILSLASGINKSYSQQFVVYGFVVDDHKLEPIEGQRIFITSDTDDIYYCYGDTVTSDSEGFFVDTIDFPFDYTIQFKIYTYDCIGRSVEYKFNAPSPNCPYYFELCTNHTITCNANFSYTLSPSTSLKVNFHDHSYMADYYVWNFGDSTYSYLPNPEKIYAVPGIYNVKLKISNNQFCFDEIIKVINVSNVYCDANFSYTHNEFNPLEVQFAEQSTGLVNFYYWDFGDGTGSLGRNPYKQYSIPGDYDVTLKVFDSQPVYNIMDSITKTISISPEEFYNFGGQVFSGLFPSNYSYTELYRKENTAFVFEESEVTNDQGVFYFYKKYKGKYIIRAHDVVVSGSTALMPAYIGNKLFWQDALIIKNDSNSFNYDIKLIQPLSLPCGNCQIDGYVTAFQAGHLNPVSNISLFLLNSDKQPYATVYTDSAGYFAFPPVGYGTYTIYPEVTGINTTPITVVLDEITNSARDLFFVMNNNSVTGIEDPSTSESQLTDIQLFPNPASDKTNLFFNSKDKFTARIIVTDLTGRFISGQILELNNHKHQITISTENWENGTYFVSIITESMARSLKLIKISN